MAQMGQRLFCNMSSDPYIHVGWEFSQLIMLRIITNHARFQVLRTSETDLESRYSTLMGLLAYRDPTFGGCFFGLVTFELEAVKICFVGIHSVLGERWK